jgi:hypothetical protein
MGKEKKIQPSMFGLVEVKWFLVHPKTASSTTGALVGAGSQQASKPPRDET